jgi:hydroxymethylglutaryl-CoA synthase
LAAVLDVAEPDDLILLTSFGSGAGSDSFVLRATDLLPEARDRAPSVASLLESTTESLTYGEYAKLRDKIIVGE